LLSGYECEAPQQFFVSSLDFSPRYGVDSIHVFKV
jgi:hypothetical protein